VSHCIIHSLFHSIR
jgi:alpha-ketoglutarate-dependent taurine dioxygenase